MGEAALNFHLHDFFSGKETSLSSYRGRPVFLGFFCGCDRCRSAARQIAAEQRAGEIPGIVAVTGMDREGINQFRTGTGLKGTFLADPHGVTAGRYDSENCPRLWAISAKGIVTYRSQEALENESLDQALATLSQGVGARSE